MSYNLTIEKAEVIAWCNENIVDALAHEGFETCEKNIEVVHNSLKNSQHAISDSIKLLTKVEYDK